FSRLHRYRGGALRLDEGDDGADILDARQLHDDRENEVLEPRDVRADDLHQNVHFSEDRIALENFGHGHYLSEEIGARLIAQTRHFHLREYLHFKAELLPVDNDHLRLDIAFRLQALNAAPAGGLRYANALGN